MKLIHTMLFFIREQQRTEDMNAIAACLTSLEKSTYHTVVLYNQGCLTNDELKSFLSGFALDIHIIGQGINVGTLARQDCFHEIWNNYPDTEYISELHVDMIFSEHWEDSLVEYLECHDEPMISCGIIDKQGNLSFLGKTVPIPDSFDQFDPFLKDLRTNLVLHGFSNPCVHVSRILREVGGYNAQFLKGKQCYEDDSLLLGYYYYYGTRVNWHPKINYNSVVYHAVAGQRLGLGHNVLDNFNGLVKQYGAMGLKHLSILHQSMWHKVFFAQEYEKILKQLN